MTTATLPVVGLSRFSMVDWPGQLVATVFTQGCSWRCPYCHNPELQPLHTQSTSDLDWEDVVDFARSRAGLLDGLVFSGGEPTRHRGLLPAMREIRPLGLRIGLHTNGMYPALLSDILDADTVDWVGLDIKASKDAYPVAIGCPELPQAAEHVWQSLELLQAWSRGSDSNAFEIRTTLFDDPRFVATLPELARDLAECGVENWALQRLRLQGATEKFRQSYEVGAHPRWDDVIGELKRIVPTLTVR